MSASEGERFARIVDGMTAVMLMVVCIVSSLVHLYSVGYMHGDRRYERFFAFLGFFTFSMLGIVLANNLFFLYVFWELVGLSSYLLIGFFFDKHSAANANKKAFITNRVGDWGFWLGILAFFTATGTLNYFELFAHVHAGTLGWVGFMTYGMAYWLIPRLFQTELYSKRMMATHFWTGTIGILLYIIPIYAAGLTQGLMWRAIDSNGNLAYPDFVETVLVLMPM